MPAANAASTTFRGPLNGGPDPFMTYYSGNYYLATTQGDAIRMWKSPSIGGLLGAASNTVFTDSNTSRNQQMWAPAFYLIDGHWYLYYTSDDGTDENHRLHVAESAGTDPLGPYTYKAELDPPGANYFAIDPALLQQNGKLYMVWSGAGTEGHNLLYIAPMSDPTTISGARTYLPSSGGCTEVREAPSIVQHGGTSFLVYSTCDTGKPDYQLWMKSIPMTSDPLVASNWHQYTSAVFARNDAAGVYGPGSNGFFTSPDGSESWIVYHAKNTASYTYDGRTTRAQKFSWNSDGTPNFGAPVGAGVDQALPAGDPGSGNYWINDTNTTNGSGSVAYTGTWTAYPSCGTACFHGDDHGSNQTGATATFTFTGTRIVLLSAKDAGNGIAGISVDGGTETTRDFYASVRQGQQVIYTSPGLASGTHTLRIRVTGTKNASSSNTYISVDRAEVY